MKRGMLPAVLALLAFLAAAARADGPVWPPAPDAARVEYVGELALRELAPRRSFLGKVLRTLGGRAEGESLSLPFDVLVCGETLYLTCQNLPALVEVRPAAGDFRLHTCEALAVRYPIGLCRDGDAVLVTDSESRAVYRFAEGRLAPFITEGLTRPTGIAATGDRIYVVDTGDHAVKVFDRDGRPRGALGSGESLHFPTFAAAAGDEILVNDSLNYRVCRFNAEGRETASFGREGDGPGSFARPKGLGVDRDDHVYVVDTLFDNIQVFDREGRLLLVIGGRGQGPGEFWSPGGFDVAGDLLYVADTYNDRVQILRYLGGGE